MSDYQQAISLFIKYSVYEKLKIKAATDGKKLKDFLSEELERIANTIDDVDKPDISEPEPDLYMPIFTDPNDAIEFRNSHIMKISEYLSVSELNNYQAFRKIGSFIDRLIAKKQLGLFMKQFEAYVKLREYYMKPPPTINKFLGNETTGFTGGEWCRENWINKMNILMEKEDAKRKSQSKLVDEDYKQEIISRLSQ